MSGDVVGVTRKQSRVQGGKQGCGVGEVQKLGDWVSTHHRAHHSIVRTCNTSARIVLTTRSKRKEIQLEAERERGVLKPKTAPLVHVGAAKL